MADEDTVLEEAMDNLKEAGQRIRATQSLMRSQGMPDGENHPTCPTDRRSRTGSKTERAARTLGRTPVLHNLSETRGSLLSTSTPAGRLTGCDLVCEFLIHRGFIGGRL
jgi:hypothetical protein